MIKMTATKTIKKVKINFALAKVNQDLGNKEAFINHIEKVLALNPNLGHAYYHLSHVKNSIRHIKTS